MKVIKKRLGKFKKDCLCTINANKDRFEYSASVESVDELIELLKLVRNHKEIKNNIKESGFDDLFFDIVPIAVKMVVIKHEFAGFTLDEFVLNDKFVLKLQKTVQPSQTKKKG